jgi:tetratricopeptide (TPR) repeat protein
MKDEYARLADRHDVLDRFEAEWEQFRAAQAWAAGATQPEAGDADLAYLFASSAQPLVGLRRPPSVLREWIVPALSHDRAVRDPGLLAENLSRLGSTHSAAGEFLQAREAFQQALDMHRRIDPGSDPRYYEMQEAGYQANIAYAEQQLGNRGPARAAYEHALEVLHRVGEEREEGRMWTNLGILHAEDESHEEAIEAYRRAADIASRVEDTDGLELALGAMGNSLTDLERLEDARTQLEEALSLSRRLGDNAREALRLGNLAKVMFAERKYDDALRLRSEALSLAKKMRDRRSEALQLHGIGQIHLSRKQEGQAQPYFAEAERIFQAIGMREDAANSARAGAAAARRRTLRSALAAYDELIHDGRPEEALEALDGWVALGHDPTPAERSMLAGRYGLAEQGAGRLESAAERYGEALKLDRNLPHNAMKADHFAKVGDLYRQLGDGQHAELAYGAALQLADVPQRLRERLAHGLQLAQELRAENRSGGLDPEVARNVGVELANRSLRGEVVDVSVTFDDGHTITGRVVSVALAPKLPEITLELPGGLPLALALGRISSISLRT